MARRAKGEGSIFKRADGRWAVKLTINGQEHWDYGRTKKEAAQLLGSLRRQIEEGVVPDSKLTLGQFLTQWIAQRKGNIAYKTWSSYESIIRLHILPDKIATLRLQSVKPLEITNFYQRLRQKGIGARTLEYVHNTLAKALNDASKSLGLIAANPVLRVEKPKVPRRPVEALPGTTALQILDVIQNPLVRLAAEIALFTGLRRGEICGLRWEHVDLSNRVIHVVQQLQETEEGVQPTDVKTKGSRRTVTIPDALYETLARIQLKEGYVLHWPDGRPVRPDWLSKAFYREIRYIDGVPNLRFHDLRHIHATLLLQAGVHPKLASSRLGHSRTGITLDLYSHVIQGIDQGAAAAIDHLVRAAKESARSAGEKQESKK